MKHRNILCITLLSLASLTGCAVDESPSTVVRKLHATISNEGENGNWAEFCVPNASYRDIPTAFSDRHNKIDNTAYSIGGTVAHVDIVYKNGSRQEVRLIRLGGKWKVKTVYKVDY